MKGSILTVILGCLVGEVGLADTAHAQGGEPAAWDSTGGSPERVRLDEPFGAGVHLGWPVGLVLQWQRPARTYDLLLAWELDEFVLAHSHVRLYERSFSGSPRGRWYLGPGLVIGARRGTFRVGLSGEAGLGYRMPPVDFFLQLRSRLEFLPTTRVGVTFGLGGYVHF